MKCVPVTIKSSLSNKYSLPDNKDYFLNESGNKVLNPSVVRALVACMDMQAVLGGAASHWGGPSALTDLYCGIFAKMFAEKNWFENFNFVNDAGHCENALYAIKALYSLDNLTLDKLKGFRSIDSFLSGHGEAHLWKEGVFLSNGPLGSAFPQAQGLAMADKHAGRKRTTIAVISDGASFEGEAKEAFSAIPGLAKKGLLAPFVAVISDNNTKLSGRIDEDAFSMNDYFNSLETQGWKVLKLENGNCLKSCVSSINKALDLVNENPNTPVVIHAITTKGFGVKKTEESKSGGHGFPLKKASDLREFVTEIFSNSNIPEFINNWILELEKTPANKKDSSIVKEKIQVGVSNALIDLRKNNIPIVSITSDLPGSTGVANFRKAFPDDSFDVGVAESNMISSAVGFSKNGYIPVVDTFAQFGVTKGSLPLVMAQLSNAPMIAFFSHTGFQDAADGASHQSLSYFAMTSCIPNVETYSLSCSSEAYSLVTEAITKFHNDLKNNKTPKTYIFFLGRETFPQRYREQTSYQLGLPQVVTNETPDSKALIVCNGSLVSEALIAHKELLESGINTTVVNASCVSNPNIESYKKLLSKNNNVLLTIEDHQQNGGMGSILSNHLILNKIKFTQSSLHVDKAFGRSAYNANELYKLHGMDSSAIIKAVKELISS